MARKQESLGVLLVKAPWWVSATLAPLAYAGLKWGVPLFAATTTNTILKTFAPGVAGLAPYAFGFLCIISVISFFFGLKRRRLVDTRTSLASLNDISWKEFEWMVGEAFRRRGYAVEESLGRGAHGGIDVVLRGKGGKTLVQCKQWRKSSVGAPVVRELYGLMTSEGANAGIVVTSGQFTREAREFASGKPVELIDGHGLLKLIKDVQRPNNDSQRTASPEATPAQAPKCPTCGSPMVLRVAKRSANAGSSFWGCSRYPACRGIRNHTGAR